MKLFRFSIGLITILLLIASSSLFATNSPSVAQASTKPTITKQAKNGMVKNDTNNDFSPIDANKKLDQLSLKLSIENLNIGHLKDAVNVLTKLQKKAERCVDVADKDIKEIDKLWIDTKLDIEEKAELTSVQKYLKTKKDELTNRRSECQLFIIRSEEAITTFSEAMEEITTKELLKVKPTLWSKLFTSIKITKNIKNQFNKEAFYENSGLIHFEKPLSLMLLLAPMLLALVLGIYIKRTLINYIQTKQVETFSDQLKFILSQIGHKYIIWLSAILMVAITTTIFGLLNNQITYFMIISYTLSLYVITLMLIMFFFYPFSSHHSLSGLKKTVSSMLTTRLKILASISTLGFIIYVICLDQKLSLQAIDLARTIFITVFAISLISILWLINKLPKLLEYHPLFRFTISLLLTICLLTIIAAEWLGYQRLVTYFLKGILFSLALLFLACLAHKLLTLLLKSFLNEKLYFQETMRKQLGIKRHEQITELFGLRIIIYVLIWGTVALCLLHVWGISATTFNIILESIVEGFKIGGLHIVPSRIFSGFVFFILMSILLRWIRNAIEGRTGIGVERGSQEALAAIVSYVGFSVILLIALLIAGVNFAGLAIIAGALSVGIGFGLQNIVNNFVSGLVLLIERPIKPGDRVLIGDTEGFVKKISLRYTQIKTLNRADLIVPNAEIISNQVTNLMFHDFYGRITVSVGVKYQTDPELVKKVLLEVALAHPEVITDDPTNQPFIYFREFGNSSLNFDLFCVIRNVNLRYVVDSELHFAVEKAFHKHDIVIAFPQQDVHIKNLPENVCAEKTKKGQKK